MLSEVVPAKLQWDVAPSANGDSEIAFGKPGGAINALMLRSASGTMRALSSAYPLQSFSEPRFARSAAHPPDWLTAVVDNRTCVAFPLGTPSAQCRTLGECAQGLLVHYGPGFAFIFKTVVPGPVRGNLIAPGRLHSAMLDAELRPTGPPAEIFDGTIFEFDADVIKGKLVVLATTPRGVVIASEPSPRAKFLSREYEVPATLTSPAVAGSASGKAILAALDSSGSGPARVVTTEVAIP